MSMVVVTGSDLMFSVSAAPHVIYQIDKSPEQPCSVTHSLSFFPDEENGVTNITGPPKTPPTNLTVVTVEGCPSFVIIDWEKTDNETTGELDIYLIHV